MKRTGQMMMVGVVGGAILLSAGCAMPKQLYAHAVYFTLKDGVNDAQRDAQISDAKELLSKIKEVKWVDSGHRDPGSTRDVNNQDFDIGLHVYFANRAGLDAYTDHPKHQEYVKRYKDNWKSVEVFDYMIVDGNYKARY